MTLVRALAWGSASPLEPGGSQLRTGMAVIGVAFTQRGAVRWGFVRRQRRVNDGGESAVVALLTIGWLRVIASLVVDFVPVLGTKDQVLIVDETSREHSGELVQTSLDECRPCRSEQYLKRGQALLAVDDP